MTVMSTTGKAKQHFDFALECPDSQGGIIVLKGPQGQSRGHRHFVFFYDANSVGKNHNKARDCRVSKEALFHLDFYLSCQLQSAADHFGKETCDDAGLPVPVDQKASQT
ncbi:hypothetical protein CB1_000389004 [Camelus ferus]|nr:hypothetical protein CB1_000389004 [Camelus ferus]